VEEREGRREGKERNSADLGYVEPILLRSLIKNSYHFSLARSSVDKRDDSRRAKYFLANPQISF
jgi:hypothetical protein